MMRKEDKRQSKGNNGSTYDCLILGLSLVYPSLIYTCVFMDTLTHLFPPFPYKCKNSSIALDNSMNGQRQKIVAENTLDNTIFMNLAPLVF